MITKQDFLNFIELNPYDEVIRKIYADFLDENDQPEEADFFRKWTLEKHLRSEHWLNKYVDEIREIGVEDEREETAPTYSELIKAAHKHLDGEDVTIYLGFETPELVYERRKEFWKHFQIVTGRRIADSDYSRTFFRCGC